MTTCNFFGWCAASLMLTSFACRDARWLRGFAIAANLAFIAYGLSSHLPPIAALHLILLPLNVWRLLQALRRPKAEGYDRSDAISSSRALSQSRRTVRSLSSSASAISASE